LPGAAGVSAPPRVAVVGAGPAGMAAAHRLARAGASVEVLEAAAEPGGRTRTDVLDGWRVDAAVQLVAASYTTFLRLLRDAGGGGLPVRSPGRDALWRRGKAHEVVFGSPTSMLASGALPLTLKLKMGASYLPFLRRHAGDLSLDALPRAAGGGLDGESIAAWGERTLGRDFVDLLAAPMLATLYGAAPDEVSAGFYHALARQGMELEVLALEGGAQGFCAALARALAAAGGTLRTATRVDALRSHTGGVDLSGAGWSAGYDAAVVAVPPAAARALVAGALPDAAAWLAGVRTRPAVSLALLLERPVGVRWFGLSFARGETRALGAACVGENKGAGLVPPGRGLLTAFAAPAACERLAELDADGIAAALLPELSRPFPGIERRIVRAEAYRWGEGWTLFPPGHLAHLGRWGGGAPEGGEPVALAGDYLVAPTVEGAALSGVRAAERIAARLGIGGAD
jgi:protoporphyrinogen/coproporphyrinogen III oxidase